MHECNATLSRPLAVGPNCSQSHNAVLKECCNLVTICENDSVRFKNKMRFVRTDRTVGQAH